MPSVSIVVPTRDRLGFLKECIASIRHQTVGDWECVVVDDGSADGTSDWLASLEDDRFRTVRSESSVGLPAARTIGLREVETPLVLFLDDDDRLHPHGLERLVSAMNDAPDAVFCAGARIAFDDRGHTLRARHPRRPTRRDVTRELLSGRYILVPSQTLFRTDLVFAVDMWDETKDRGEDRYLLLRLNTLGRALLIPDTVVYYRRHAGQRSLIESTRVRRNHTVGYVSKMPDIDQDRALRYLAAWDLWDRADDAFARDDFRAALSAHVRAAVVGRTIIVSPLVGPALTWGITKSLIGLIVGRRAADRLRRVKSTVRHLLKKDPLAGGMAP